MVNIDMNLLINQQFLKIIFNIFILALIGKGISLVFSLFLPHFGVNYIKDYSINLYHSYNFSKAFGLYSNSKKTISIKPTYQLKNIKLKAIYINNKNGKGLIVIEDRKKLFFIFTGDTFKGYKLIDITPTKAIFEKDNKHYELSLKEESLKDKIDIITSSNSKIILNKKIAILKKDIDKYKKNFNEIWKNISITEERDPQTKKIKGFRITYINKNSIFSKIGLKKDDIIIGANNKIFHNYADVFKLYNNIDKYNAIKLMIIRNNQQKDIEYEIY